MSNSPNIVRIASLVGDNARAAMLTALMGGEALTASELAREAGITPQTASSHLARLRDGGLVTAVSQGRHRYFRLVDDDVSRMLENLMGLAERTSVRQVRTGPSDPALRKARICYDHLAGDLGVLLYDGFVHQRLVRISDESDDAGGTLSLTPKGQRLCEELGISLLPRKGSRRPVCRPCLDWSVRRYHLAGVLGAGILDLCLRKRWTRRLPDSRIMRFSPRGEVAFRQTFGL